MQAYDVERWHPVTDYEGIYEVSDRGSVRRVLATPGTRAGKILKPIKMAKGYLKVCLRDSGRDRQMLIHRIVAMAFVGPCPEGQTVNHKNGVKDDNRPSNLEYCSLRENLSHARRSLGYDNSGEQHGQARFANSDVIRMRTMANDGAHFRAIAAAFDTDRRTVSDIVKRRRWKHL